ncbi:MAG: hypothetical protein H0V66_05005 [Bdellovibrionales bacterium]|nr:hypothetical protein [Bdellovibrionales bacterium]
MKTNSLVVLFSLMAFIAACSSTTAKLTKHDATNDNRIVYGKIIDLNPDSIPADLQFTYTLSETPQNTFVRNLKSQFPRLEPKSNFFWISVPKTATYFGVSSIHFKLNNVDGEAIIRDDKNHKPLFGTQLQPGNAPVYIGDITIKSGTRKYSVGLDTEGFDLKEAYIKNNAALAKEFLDKNGIDSNGLIISPFKLKNQQQANTRYGKKRL